MPRRKIEYGEVPLACKVIAGYKEETRKILSGELARYNPIKTLQNRRTRSVDGGVVTIGVTHTGKRITYHIAPNGRILRIRTH